jgi:decaprenyl-phosphate phosphoribosyltransferase
MFLLSNLLDVFRPKRWYRNLSMVLGVIIAVKLLPIHASALFTHHHVGTFILAFIALCFVASGNYGINEVLDAKSDAHHPQKKFRAIPSGKVSPRLVIILSVIFYVLGLVIVSFSHNIALVISVGLLLISGIVYNVPPIRLKDKAYVDFTSEALNNPIRFLVGWYAVANSSQIFPTSFLLAYWFAGVFLMAAKRFGEIRLINNKKKAAAYRPSLLHYDQEHLIMAMIGAVAASYFMFGVLCFKYSVDLVIILPFAVGWIIWFFKLAFEENTVVKDPERIFEKKGFLLYSLVIGLLFTYFFYTGNHFLNWVK